MEAIYGSRYDAHCNRTILTAYTWLLNAVIKDSFLNFLFNELALLENATDYWFWATISKMSTLEIQDFGIFCRLSSFFYISTLTISCVSPSWYQFGLDPTDYYRNIIHQRYSSYWKLFKTLVLDDSFSPSMLVNSSRNDIPEQPLKCSVR